MRKGQIIDPRMYEAIPAFYPQLLDVMDPEATGEDEWGQPIPGEKIVYESLRCNVAPAGGDEVRDGSTRYGLHTHSISVPGLYDIETGWKVKVQEDEEYTVLLAEKDSQRSQTRIRCEGRAM